MPAKSQDQRKKGWKHTEEYKNRLSKNRTGNLNPMWSGGRSPDKKAEYARQWRKKNEDYVRDVEYKKRFGLTLEEYDKMLLMQNGVCAICEQACPRGRLCVDHDHKTKRIRGLLCRKCNITISLFGDSIQWLKKAEVYLARYK